MRHSPSGYLPTDNRIIPGELFMMVTQMFTAFLLMGWVILNLISRLAMKERDE